MDAVAHFTRLRSANPPGTGSDVLDPEPQELLERSRARSLRPLQGRELAPSLVLGTAFLAVAAALAALGDSSRPVMPLAAFLLVFAYALASRVEFEVGGGSAVPTALVFVPMVFCLPAHLLPLFVAGGLATGNVIDHVRGGRHIERIASVLVSSIHSLGPATILVVAGEPAPSLASWEVYAGALAAQFGLDLASSLLHEWLRNGVRPGLQLRFMSMVYLVDIALVPIGLLAALFSHTVDYGFLLVLPLIGLLQVFAAERSRRLTQAIELGRAYRGTALLLGDVVEADDADTGSHSRDVVELVLAVAERLGLRPAERQRAEFAALLHDVGKIRVPGAIINKAGPLTPEERAIIQTHTVEGQKLLARVGGALGEVGDIVRSCHERWDGKGYPDGLLADETPLIARIIACCDAFSAMVQNRPYRPALSVDDALAELRHCAGTQFDPAVVRVLISVLTEQRRTRRPLLTVAA
jgi:putative nucleotidyltransferase with HDIG domain